MKGTAGLREVDCRCRDVCKGELRRREGWASRAVYKGECGGGESIGKNK